MTRNNGDDIRELRRRMADGEIPAGAWEMGA